jgi:hypothetical protein
MVKILFLCLGLFLCGGLAGYAVTIGGDKGVCLAIISIIIGGIIAFTIAWE